jgi:Ankyrin repeats (many copies)
MISKIISLFTCYPSLESTDELPIESILFQNQIDVFTRAQTKKYFYFYKILELTSQYGYFPTDVTLSHNDMLVHLSHYRQVILKEMSIDIAPFHKYFGSDTLSAKMEMIVHTGLFTMEMLSFTIDENGQSFVHHAVKSRNLPMLKCLLETGADPNIQDKFGNTALFYCCGKAHKDGETVKMLLTYGAKTDIVNKDGLTFENKAKVKRNFKNLKILFENNLKNI